MTVVVSRRAEPKVFPMMRNAATSRAMRRAPEENTAIRRATRSATDIGDKHIVADAMIL
jgi:hypothetical protein